MEEMAREEEVREMARVIICLSFVCIAGQLELVSRRDSMTNLERNHHECGYGSRWST
jgi:hypothetical protein